MRDFWPVVCSATSWNEPLFRSIRSKNTNRIPEGALRSLGVSETDSYATHAFRRGASIELKSSCSTLANVLKTVGWTYTTFMGYRPFVGDGEVDIRPILANSDGFESSEEEETGASDTSSPEETGS